MRIYERMKELEAPRLARRQEQQEAWDKTTRRIMLSVFVAGSILFFLEISVAIWAALTR